MKIITHFAINATLNKTPSNKLTPW